ncbi:stress response translation initiation inhibitor YciH [Parasalinivibrio latis]|uniref:stress response translation initiation inhibitor YciH n=1 Tax=Parasalinivibrio latis TaxID=2952610 RepID=UPI0030E41C0C
MSNDGSRLVYSTDVGRIKEEKSKPDRPKGDGVVRIQRQTKGRKGKGVCIVTGLDLDDAALKLVAAELKKVCGCGGSVKDGTVEIQGDKRDQIKAYLEKKGHTVKLAGG